MKEADQHRLKDAEKERQLVAMVSGVGKLRRGA
jgi:hypothetical protein